MAEEPELPFVEQFRPLTLEDIIGNQQQIETLKAFAAVGPLSLACILWGPAGVGKTTAALALVRDYYVRRGIYDPKTDLARIRANSPILLKGTFPPSLFVNTRVQGSVEFIRDRVFKFMQGAAPPGAVKFVVFDEADALSDEAQEALQPLMERFANTRIIFTMNVAPEGSFGEKGLRKPIVSRAAGCIFRFQPPTREDLTQYLGRITARVGVEIPKETLEKIATESESPREAVGKLGAEVALAKAKKLAPVVLPPPPPAPTPAPEPTIKAIAPPTPAPPPPTELRKERPPRPFSEADVEVLFNSFRGIITKKFKRELFPSEREQFEELLSNLERQRPAPSFAAARRQIEALAKSIAAIGVPGRIVIRRGQARINELLDKMLTEALTREEEEELRRLQAGIEEVEEEELFFEPPTIILQADSGPELPGGYPREMGRYWNEEVAEENRIRLEGRGFSVRIVRP